MEEGELYRAIDDLGFYSRMVKNPTGTRKMMNKVKCVTTWCGGRAVMFLPFLPLATEYFFHNTSASL